jgi:hypothetical protein
MGENAVHNRVLATNKNMCKVGQVVIERGKTASPEIKLCSNNNRTAACLLSDVLLQCLPNLVGRHRSLSPESNEND